MTKSKQITKSSSIENEAAMLFWLTQALSDCPLIVLVFSFLSVCFFFNFQDVGPACRDRLCFIFGTKQLDGNENTSKFVKCKSNANEEKRNGFYTTKNDHFNFSTPFFPHRSIPFSRSKEQHWASELRIKKEREKMYNKSSSNGEKRTDRISDGKTWTKKKVMCSDWRDSNEKQWHNEIKINDK